ncbi:MAG: amino acid adenylation domain-containing protein, partial [Gemmatimonadetes bacterium]|nr:amino acid adenylation domain-containing protein [Gemmatimonadota bacterium]
TLFMVLLAAFDVLLARVSGSDDVVVGSPVAGRTRPETEALIGYFVNLLPLRADLSGRPSFRALLSRVRRASLDAWAHQDVPLQRIADALGVERTLRHAPLFQVTFALQTRGTADAPAMADADEADAFPTAPADAAVEYELTLDLREAGEALLVRASYATGRFEHATALRLLARWQRLLDALLADPGTPVHAHDLLSTEERAALLAAPAVATAPETTFVHRFARVAAERGDALAVSYDGQVLSYAALAARAAGVSARLRALGVGPESRVAVLLERGMELPVALLGALGAGGAFVCIDPAYPDERIAHMLDDSGAAAVLTLARHAPRISPAIPLLTMDGAEAWGADGAPSISLDLDAENAAYVVYTSGSTGRPKGAVISHASLLAFSDAGAARYEVDAGARMLQLTSPSFDASVLEMFPAWVAGACLVVAPPGPAEPAALASLLAREGVTHAYLTAPHWHEWVRELEAGHAAVPAAMRLLVVGAERLEPAAAAAWMRHASLPVENSYGPSECTVAATGHRLRPEDGAAPEVPIGTALAGAGTYVLDRALRPVPPGTAGELCIGGAGVARGYLGRPALTAERFVPDPFAGQPGARMYRTGDRVRWISAHGGALVLEFLGRLDRQLKLRGFRVEPGEVEAALRAHPGVAGAVVDVRGTPPRLVAWIVGAVGEPAPEAAALRRWLAARLPAHLVPAAVAPVPRLPLTPSGKVDRAALPDPAADEAGWIAPATRTERVIAASWTGLLGVARVGAGDSFFERGGDSLRAMRSIAAVRQDFGVDLPLRALFESPVLADFAARVDAAAREGTGGAERPLERVEGDAFPLSFAQERLWFVERLEPGRGVYNVPFPLRLRGALDVAALERALGELVSRH